MSNGKKNAKVVAKKSTVVTLAKPISLAEALSGKGEAVSKAVAERVAEKTKASGATPPKAAAKPKAKKEPAEKKETVAMFMRRLITDGKDNETVFAAAVKEFGIGEDKKHYPSWYRCEMKRKSNAARAEAKGKGTGAKGKELPKVTKVPTKKVAAGKPRTLTIISTTKAS